MAYLGGHEKKTPDETIASFLPAIERGAADDRNFVKKAVSWALRRVPSGRGKRRDGTWHGEALALAERLKASESRAVRWVGSDAARELRGRTG